MQTGATAAGARVVEGNTGAAGGDRGGCHFGAGRLVELGRCQRVRNRRLQTRLYLGPVVWREGTRGSARDRASDGAADDDGRTSTALAGGRTEPFFPFTAAAQN